MRDAVTSRGPKCFMVSKTVHTAVNNLLLAGQAAARLSVLPDAQGEFRPGLQPIMGAACQEPLGSCFLINALSDGVDGTQRLVQGKRG